ncbi:DUF2460 domain-containing protein [Palleronia caenipelagi]|uniref:TIGR02217 family protein n=1 Tax=Palleronia caenipelagi TaxID=2489174 RepID=A0A547Q060_9RHOB|nr:DUF2460 domain-containing protein [Palleronia caenipelagi]TRD19767.1 TIGR02217 family protein [Palleronia caenipelagi]
MAFHEIRFPTQLSFGAVGGPERRTEIVTLASGNEERSTPWAHARRRYDAGTGLRSMADMETLIAFFEARMGQLHGFRWKDWSDFSSASAGQERTPTDQVIGVADGATTRFSLTKRYGDGEAAYQRPITKPVAGTVTLAVQGLPLTEGPGFTLDTTTGEIVLTDLPVSGAIITAGYDFDVPVRFDTDRIEMSLETFNAGQVPRIPVIEVRP